MEKSPVKLRQRKLADGRLSLLLDRSVDGGHEYEFLKLYFVPETDTKSKRENARTLRKAGRHPARTHGSLDWCQGRSATEKTRNRHTPFGVAPDQL